MTGKPEESDQIRVWTGYPADATPPEVKNWENAANAAPSNASAHLQIAFAQLLQLRMIKLILAWALLVIPALTAIATVILIIVLDSDGSSSRPAF